MLVHFSVENFRVFREQQDFSMVCEVPPEKSIFRQRTFETGFSLAPHLYYQACLFGANGAGKSAIIDAIGFVTWFVANSVQNVSKTGLRVEPFIFSEEWAHKPSKFSIAFIVDNTLYNYEFVISRDRVEEELLTARPKSTGRSRQLFYRCYDHDSEQYQWEISSLYLKGERGYWRTQTRPDALFLTTAVQFDGGILKEAYEWLVKRCKFLTGVEGHYKNYTAGLLENAEKKSEIMSLLRRLGINLYDITAEKVDPLSQPEFLELPKHIQDLVRENLEAKEQFLVTFARSSNDIKPVGLRLEKESRGTQVLFGLVGPILDVLANGYSVVADDLGAELHPLALRKLISLFSNPEVNQKNAQIIFSTHDVSVTQDRVIENDDIWLLQKKADLAASLYPLSDFKDYDQGTFGTRYLQGLFGGVPIIV